MCENPGCAHCSGSTVHKGGFVLILRALGKGASEGAPFRDGCQVTPRQAAAFLCKWQVKVQYVYSGSLFELHFLPSIQGAESHAQPGPAQAGVSALCAHRGRGMEQVWAPDSLRSPCRMAHSNAMCTNHAATPQATDVPDTSDSAAQLSE